MCRSLAFQSRAPQHICLSSSISSFAGDSARPRPKIGPHRRDLKRTKEFGRQPNRTHLPAQPVHLVGRRGPAARRVLSTSHPWIVLEPPPEAHPGRRRVQQRSPRAAAEPAGITYFAYKEPQLYSCSPGGYRVPGTGTNSWVFGTGTVGLKSFSLFRAAIRDRAMV